MTPRKTLAAVTTALGLAVTAAPMVALTAQGAAAQSQEAYSAEKLDAFTNALLDVAELRQKYTNQLQGTEGQEQQDAIVAEANAEIEKTIENADNITVDEYVEIAQAVGEDEDLQARVTKRIEARGQQ
ncbi:protein of unknown function [Salinihabitans flavidus]|uniref:DUF4168 domain-containing protein n=1 Tax=Salinihabitans flavidus TaxID=569882 RepID=A0A1H8U8E5_9RHOB|nr:DUF4168 domain-containing protein [Salinihabitans flavidus]SEO99114.1 protein of unknown function [Salinihabitans flavidus]